MKTIKVKGKYQFKLEKSRLERTGEKIISSGPLPKEKIVDGFSHFINIECND